MINLMYLVLTALLALNVSAEVMNAFFSLDKGMKTSRSIVDKNNNAMKGGIDATAAAYPTPKNDELKKKAAMAMEIGNDFNSYIEGIRNLLMEKAKGPSKDDPEIPKDIRNKDITTKMFVNDGLGNEIEAKIKETRAKFLELVGNDAKVAEGLPLDVEPLPANTKMNSWAEYKFKQMPVAALFPVLGKMQSDAKSSTSAVMNWCADQMGKVEIKFDAFEPAVSAQKSYVIAGEKYSADVFLSAFSTSADNVSISVNGSGLPVTQGKAHYETGTSGVGERSYNVSINVKNPLTGEMKNYSKEFKYEVGQRSVAVSLDKMNVFYIGVDNPISVSAAGVSSNEVKVSGSGAGISVSPNGGGKYTVKVSTPGEATLTVSGGGASQSFQYRVKRIPDPTPLLGAKHRSKAMGNGEFKAQSGIAAVLENFDFDVRCDVVGFEATYLKKRQDPSPEIANAGARFNEKVQSMVNQAGPGDQYFFDNVKAKCPGDGAPRNLGALSFKIK
jgi:gliding motility-associated protein GldM